MGLVPFIVISLLIGLMSVFISLSAGRQGALPPASQRALDFGGRALPERAGEREANLSPGLARLVREGRMVRAAMSEPMRRTASLSGRSRLFVWSGSVQLVAGSWDAPSEVLAREEAAQIEADGLLAGYADALLQLSGVERGRLSDCGYEADSIAARMRDATGDDAPGIEMLPPPPGVRRAGGALKRYTAALETISGIEWALLQGDGAVYR